jgi:hypothetical protein
VIGSLNEPIAVDDRTGMDLTVTKCFTSQCVAAMSADGDMDGPAGTPVTGLESTLKVEMVAGDQKRLDPISPVWGKEGSYKTTFYPTVATTFAFHLMGTINDVPVDLTFTCVPESGAAPAESKTPKKLSEGVTELTHAGKFGCALPKEDLGFPEKAPSLLSLSQSQGSAKDMAGMGIAIAALGLSVVALARRK